LTLTEKSIDFKSRKVCWEPACFWLMKRYTTTSTDSQSKDLKFSTVNENSGCDSVKVRVTYKHVDEESTQ